MRGEWVFEAWPKIWCSTSSLYHLHHIVFEPKPLPSMRAEWLIVTDFGLNTMYYQLPCRVKGYAEVLIPRFSSIDVTMDTASDDAVFDLLSSFLMVWTASAHLSFETCLSCDNRHQFGLASARSHLKSSTWSYMFLVCDMLFWEKCVGNGANRIFVQPSMIGLDVHWR